MSIVSAFRGAVHHYRASRAEAALLTAHQRAVTEHARAAMRHVEEHAAWARRRVLLSTLAIEAGEYRGFPLTLPTHVGTRDGERLYAHIAEGGLVELRRDAAGTDIPTVVGAGEIWVTDRRVILAGLTVRTWEFADLHSADHHGPAMTVLPVSTRQKISGISYAAVQQDSFRRRLDLALATFHGSRDELFDAAERTLVRHLADEPVVPVAPAPVLLFASAAQ